MRIYPSHHVFQNTKRPGLAHIPIAHIERELRPQRISVEKAPDFLLDEKRDISPYENFNSDDFLLFDGEGNLRKGLLKRRKELFTYEPPNSKEFVPERFTVQCIIKKNLSYVSSQNYDIKVGVSNLNDWTDLISIFGDAPMRGVCPANVTVNGMAFQPTSLINASLSSLDFVFIASPDGIHTTNGEQIDFHAILDSHTNIWLAVDSAPQVFAPARIPYQVVPANPTLYKGAFVFDDWYGARVRDNPKLPFPSEGLSIFTFSTSGTIPILILEKRNGGYIVFSQRNLFKDLSKSANFIYEVMMCLYLQSYIATEEISSWITDAPIDFLGSLNRPFHRVHPEINLQNMIDNRGCEINHFNLMAVNVKDDKAIYDHMDIMGNLYFRKGFGAYDPPRDENTTSIYTTRNTVLLFKHSPALRIETAVRVDTRIEEGTGECFIVVHPFKSSKHRLVVSEKHEFQIPDIEKTYYLTALPIDENGESVINLVEHSAWVAGGSVLIALVEVQVEAREICADVRLLGGGLPEIMDDDYDMLDIGNLYGRAYRVGTTLIFKLPKRLKPYAERIRDAIERHKNASDLAIISYE